MTEIEAHEKIDELSNLRRNWDSYGALPIRAEIIQAAKGFASELKRDILRVRLKNDGTLTFEWPPRMDEWNDLVLTVSSESIIHFFAIGQEETAVWCGDADMLNITKFQSLIDWATEAN